MPNIFVVSAPSGAGKTSLVKELVKKSDGLSVAVSHATREKRSTEVCGENYHFVAKKDFLQLVEAKKMAEHAEVFGNFYGTSKQVIEDILASGRDVILEIDWQGFRQIKKSFPQVVGIFILLPSVALLEKRLKLRNQDDLSTIKARMAQAKEEMSHYNEYDYLVVNDDFQQALMDFQVIISAKRLETEFLLRNKKINLEFL